MSLKEKTAYIEKLRATSAHDTFIVAGQLQEDNVDPIDSWTLFQWMQKNGIPSKYIVKENDSFYDKTVKGRITKDIIVLKDLNAGISLLDHPDIWARACAFIVEWDLGGTEVDRWLYLLEDCRYVFLQHGIVGRTYCSTVMYPCHDIFNDVNVSSQKEKELIEQGSYYNRCFIAGLPRFSLFDKTNNTGTDETKTVFVMFTWRQRLSDKPSTLQDSLYWQQIKKLLCDKNIKRLQSKKIKIVAALHHSLIKNIKSSLTLNPQLEFVSQDKISYWTNHADAMVTDFSSASFDFLFQNKPVIYWIPDKNDDSYEKNGHDMEKIQNAIKCQKDFFNIIDSAEDVVRKLEDYAERKFILEKEHREKAGIWFKYRDDFSLRIYQNIKQRLADEKFYTRPMKTVLNNVKEQLQETLRINAEYNNIIKEERTAHKYFERREAEANERVKTLETRIQELDALRRKEIRRMRRKRNIFIYLTAALLITNIAYIILHH